MGEILLRDGITRRNLMVEIEDNVIDLVLKEGYSPLYGARPLKRAIERLVVSPMARELAGRSTQDTNLLRISVDRDTGELALKSVPIDEANASGTNVELRTGLTDSSVKKLRMDTGQLVEGYAMLRRKLADWLDSETFGEMQKEKQELLTDTQSPTFWDNGEDARTKLSRFYFLDRLVRRVQQLYEKAEYLEDFAVLVNKERDLRYQPDLARDYEDLHRNISYLDIELRTAHLPHRNQAMLLLRPMGMAPAQRQGLPQNAWVRRLARMYLQWAERKGYDRDLYILMDDKDLNEAPEFQRITAGNFHDLMKRFDDAPHSDEIALMFEGSNIFGFLKGERGLHRLELDPQGDELVQVLVFAIPDGTNVGEWLSDYREIKVEIEEGKRPPPPMEKLTVIRIYSLDKGQGERFIRDIRTNLRTVQIKDVIEKGQLDDFILAFLEQEEASGSWEDRYPPTFPY
jgi:protein subunit release factor A